MPDEDKCKTKLSTFKPKALRNPKSFARLQNASGNDNSSIAPEMERKEFKTDAFGNKIFGNLKPMLPMTKDYDEIVRAEAAKKVPNNLKPVRNSGGSST